jgi:transportin-1
MQSVSQFMFKATTDNDKSVAIEACEFWLTFASLDETVCTYPMMQAVQALFPQLLPALVKCLVHPQEKVDELLERNAIDEQEGADRAQDVAPVFHRSKTKGGGKEDDNEEDDDDDDDEFDDKEWTLRTCAAASLDSLSSGYPHESVLPHLLPTLQESLSHENPWVREAGILALGAISDGCGIPMGEHMTQLYPFLVNQVTAADSLPQLKSISCWTISRYSFWALEQAASNVQPDIVQKTIEAILGRILDNNRRVQVSACSALGEVIEHTGEFIIPYLETIYRALNFALERHQTRALMVSLELFGSIAVAVGPAIGEGNLPSIYVPPLLMFWANKAKVNPFDRTLLPLMESIAGITMVTGMSYQPWALQTFDGAMSIINSCLMVLSCQDFTDEEADSIICATDVLDGLVEGLGSNFPELVSNSTQFGDHFLPLISILTSHEVDGVRMSAFALMGDLAKNCPTVIQGGMAELLSEAIQCIDPLYPSVCNNAVWAVGEVCVKCIGNPASLQPYAQNIVQSLITLLMEQGYSGSPLGGLVENAASTMGRLAKVDTAFVASELPRFLNEWCDGCSKINDLLERRDAFEGFMLAFKANPQSIMTAADQLSDTLTTILFAVVSWHVPCGNLSPTLLSGEYAFEPFPKEHADLCENLRVFLHHLKDLVGLQEWNGIENNMPVNVRRLFRETYAFG